jgi:hypothetical protein
MLKKTLYVLGLLSLALFISCESAEEKKAKEDAIKAKQEKVRQDSIRVADSLYTLTQPLKVEGAIESGQGIFQALTNAGVPHNTILSVINEIRDEVELDVLRVGDRFDVEFDRADSTVVSFSFYANAALEQKITRPHIDSAWTYERIEKPTIWKYRLIDGFMKEGSSLDQIQRELGIPGFMIGVVNGVLLCKVSFRTDARAGDNFKILLAERFYEDKLIEGRVLYTSYEGVRAGHHEAWRYDDGDPKSSYTAHYTEEGEALIHSGLRYPVDRLHISSTYGYRIHPVTGKRRMHSGVDYAARTGTPVYAVAPGTVVRANYDKYGGNTVAIKHADKSTSYYLHLSRIGVRKGQNVVSRQVIGKVGATGRVTGPHLHFGFKKPNGKWMNPLQKRMIATPKLKGERHKRLMQQVGQTKEILKRELAKVKPTVAKTQTSDSTKATE